MDRDAYFAGLIDGEGCFQFEKDQRRGANYRRPTITVGMTCEKTMQALAANFGCGKLLSFQKKHPRKLLWQWRVRDRAARNVTIRLLPYLITKRAEAEEFIAHWKAKGLLDRDVPETTPRTDK